MIPVSIISPVCIFLESSSESKGFFQLLTFESKTSFILDLPQVVHLTAIFGIMALHFSHCVYIISPYSFDKYLSCPASHLHISVLPCCPYHVPQNPKKKEQGGKGFQFFHVKALSPDSWCFTVIKLISSPYLFFHLIRIVQHEMGDAVPFFSFLMFPFALPVCPCQKVPWHN